MNYEKQWKVFPLKFKKCPTYSCLCTHTLHENNNISIRTKTKPQHCEWWAKQNSRTFENQLTMSPSERWISRTNLLQRLLVRAYVILSKALHNCWPKWGQKYGQYDIYVYRQTRVESEVKLQMMMMKNDRMDDSTLLIEGSIYIYIYTHTHANTRTRTHTCVCARDATPMRCDG